MKAKIKYQSLIVGSDGFQGNLANVDIVKKFSRSRALMGLLQFPRRFIKDCSKLSASVTNLIWKCESGQGWDIIGVDLRKCTWKRGSNSRCCKRRVD